MPTENDLNRWHKPEVVAFSVDTGFVGAGTNGAMPQVAEGIFVEAEIYPHNGEIVESYWLKVRTPGTDANGNRNAEYVMFSDDLAHIGRVLTAVVDCAVQGKPSGYLKGAYDAYHNRAQIEHDEDTTEECVENVRCYVKPSNGGVEIVFAETPTPRDERVVARVQGHLPPDQVTRLVGEFEALRKFRADTVLEIEKHLAAQAVAAP